MQSSGDSEKIFFRDQIGCISVDKYIGQQSVQLSLRYTCIYNCIVGQTQILQNMWIININENFI
jgi:hypothetical protein